MKSRGGFRQEGGNLETVSPFPHFRKAAGCFMDAGKTSESHQSSEVTI